MLWGGMSISQSHSVYVGIGRRNPKNWRPESAFPHLWQLFTCPGDLTSRCYMPRHPPSTPPTSRLNAFDPLTLTDGRLDSFEGVVGERENRGLEKSLSSLVKWGSKRKGSGVWEVLDLRTSNNFVSHNLRYSPLVIFSETHCNRRYVEQTSSQASKLRSLR